MNPLLLSKALPAYRIGRIAPLLAAILLLVTAGCGGGSTGVSVTGTVPTPPVVAPGAGGTIAIGAGAAVASPISANNPLAPGNAMISGTATSLAPVTKPDTGGAATTNGAATLGSTTETITPTLTPTPTPTPTQTSSQNPGPLNPAPAISKSAKRGIAYDLADTADFNALAPGVSWWYNWSPQQSTGTPADYRSRYQMDFLPMVWNGNFNAADIESKLNANPQIRYLLVFNEPNLVDQANLTPQQAATLWPAIEAIAAHTGVKIVGPAVTWGTMPGYADPVAWLDAFYAAYRSSNAGRDPQIDYLAFHWYDYGLASQLDRLIKYGKPFWVTEFANWHAQTDGAQIDTAGKQAQQMTDMVAVCEQRADVFRYAWFTGRWNNDIHATSLLGVSGQLTALGNLYLALPF